MLRWPTTPLTKIDLQHIALKEKKNENENQENEKNDKKSTNQRERERERLTADLTETDEEEEEEEEEKEEEGSPGLDSEWARKQRFRRVEDTRGREELVGNRLMKETKPE